MSEEQLTRLLECYTTLIAEAEQEVRFYEGLIQVQERITKMLEDWRQDMTEEMDDELG